MQSAVRPYVQNGLKRMLQIIKDYIRNKYKVAINKHPLFRAFITIDREETAHYPGEIIAYLLKHLSKCGHTQSRLIIPHIFEPSKAMDRA